MATEETKPDSTDDLFKREIYEVIQPFRSGANIFNKDLYEIEIFLKDDKRIVLVRRKNIK